MYGRRSSLRQGGDCCTHFSGSLLIWPRPAGSRSDAKRSTSASGRTARWVTGPLNWNAQPLLDRYFHDPWHKKGGQVNVTLNKANRVRGRVEFPELPLSQGVGASQESRPRCVGGQRGHGAPDGAGTERKLRGNEAPARFAAAGQLVARLQGTNMLRHVESHARHGGEMACWRTIPKRRVSCKSGAARRAY